MKEYKQERWQYERKWTIGDHSGSQDNEILKRDKYYQDALEEEQAASDIMDGLNLTSEQRKAVDRVITAYNQCGAAYGAVAYRFGMKDGIRVRMEMEEVMRP